jgi:hypothetical protein
MGWTCGTEGGRERCAQGIWWGNLRERDHWGDQDVGRWEDNIKMDLEEVGGGCGDWMELAQDRDSWRALVSTVMNCGVP